MNLYGYYPDYYSHNRYNSSRFTYPYQKLVMKIQNCESVCQYMISLLLEKPYVFERKGQIGLLRDCVQACISTAIFVSNGSQFSKDNVIMCGNVCEACGIECDKHTDKESQYCSQICLDCARSCAEYIQMM